jgi:hypothetical protein
VNTRAKYINEIKGFKPSPFKYEWERLEHLDAYAFKVRNQAIYYYWIRSKEIWILKDPIEQEFRKIVGNINTPKEALEWIKNDYLVVKESNRVKRLMPKPFSPKLISIEYENGMAERPEYHFYDKKEYDRNKYALPEYVYWADIGIVAHHADRAINNSKEGKIFNDVKTALKIAEKDYKNRLIKNM